MEDSHIAEIWSLFREYVDKKNLEDAAEKYIDLLADLGVHDDALHETLGIDKYLDEAINYYLDIEEPEEDDLLNDWDD